MTVPEDNPLPSDSRASHSGEAFRSYRESAVYAAAKIVPLIFNLLFIRFYTTRFAPETVGRYETALALGIVASSFTAGWIQMAVLRFYPKWRDSGGLRSLISAAHIGLFVSLLLGGTLFGVAWLARATGWGRSLEFGLFGWAFLLFVGNSCFLVFTTYLRAQRRVGLYSLCSSLASIFNFAVPFGLSILAGATLFCLTVGTAASFLVPAFVALALAYPWFAYRPNELDSATTPDARKTLRALLVFGLPLALNQACAQLLNLSDRYAILLLRGPEEAGIYSAAYRLADFAVRFLILALMMSAYTAVTEVYDTKGKEAAEKLVASLSRLYLLAAAPAAIGIGLVQQDAMRVLTGPEFVEGGSLLIWIALGALLLGLSQYQHFGLHLGGRTTRLALMTFSAALLNLVLNLVFVPKYGYPAAAYTTFASFLYLSVIAPILGRPWLEWRVSLPSVGRIGVALVVMSATVWLARGWFESPLARLVGCIGAGAFAYGTSLFALGEVRVSDMRRLFSTRG